MPQIAEITSPSHTPAWSGSPPIAEARHGDTPTLVGGSPSKDAHKANRNKKKWKKFKSLASSLVFAKADKRAARHTESAKGDSDRHASALVPVSSASSRDIPHSKADLKGLGKKLHTYGRLAKDLWGEHVRAEQARKADKRELRTCMKTEKAEEKAIEAARKFLEQLDGVRKALHGASPGMRDKLTPRIFSRRPADSAGAELIDALQKFRAARNINQSTRPDRQARRILVAEALKSLYADARATQAGTQQPPSRVAAITSAPREAARNMHTAVRLAAADKATRDRIVSTVQELQQRSDGERIPTQVVNELLDDVVHVGLLQAAFHYQYMPLKNLLELADPGGDADRIGPAPSGRRMETLMAEQFDLIFRGYNEPGLVGPGETRIAYLERILKGYTDSLPPPIASDLSDESRPWADDGRDARAESARKEQVRLALKALATLFAIEDRDRAAALRKEILKNATSDALKLQYGNLFDRLSRLIARELHIDHNEQSSFHAARTARSAWADLQLWKEHERNRTVHPFHRPSRLRRFGKAAWFWVKYVFSDGESCAKKRVEHWEGKVDAALRGTLKCLSRVRHHDTDDGIGAKAEQAIGKQMRRLHDALDCLEAELREQGGERTAGAYLERSLLQRYGELGSAHLHNVSTVILEHGWQPRLQPRAAWSMRMGRLRDRLHPFRDPSGLQDVRAEHPDHATRLARTWHTLRATLRAEIMDQAYLSAIQQLATGLRERHRDRAAEAVKRLAELDAQSPAETPLTPPEFQRALRQLSNEDLAVLERKLDKYSWDKGRRMEDMLKPDELRRETIAEDNLFYLRALLERLHQVVSTARQNRSPGACARDEAGTDAPRGGQLPTVAGGVSGCALPTSCIILNSSLRE